MMEGQNFVNKGSKIVVKTGGLLQYPQLDIGRLFLPIK
jgi:hypothetical protein